MDLSVLPALNALLNALAASLLVLGRSLARRRRIPEHRRVMVAAFCVSSLFLASYLIHKASKDFENTTFHAVGLAKAAYLALLASHVTLAMTVPVLAITLIVLGLRGSFQRHRRIARWAWPIWLYVSVTGVLIYALLYHLNPAPAGSDRAAGLPSDARLGRLAAPLPDRPPAIENLNTVRGMRGSVEVEKPPRVGYLPGGRPAPARASPFAAPPLARRSAGSEASSRRPRGFSELGSENDGSRHA